jgi:succinyl-diaminopimelate desuccinylase
VLTAEILADPVELTRALVDVESVSGNEDEIAGQVETALAGTAHLTVVRRGNVVIARAEHDKAGTDHDRAQRVILAGHLDTVPIAGNLPSTMDGDLMHGCGTSDMKSGVALALHLAATVARPRYDVTYLFYDCEEVEADRNGLNQLASDHPDLLQADFAILLEPTYGLVEAGCQGTLRAIVSTVGRRAHSARSWMGVNAIHAAGAVLQTLNAYEPRNVTIDGCTYREGLGAVRITGGVAGNVIPDECQIEVNYRFAPDRTEAEAAAHVREVFAGFAVEITDSAPGALPGLTAAPAREFLDAVGQPPQAKLGWTDVARFAALGVPALNFGPGDPNLAHAREERVEISKIRSGADVLRRWLAA